MLLIVMMTFFAVLALDVVVPAVVLSLMAASVWLVERLPDDLFSREFAPRKGRAA
ncbi:hypothetical protein QO005_000297 [Rhizobium paknamense]|uniref:Uncharacterized protein n=2 Tax=Rhizobium paknamense TaxID=1206817 RepID=A0ABU0I8I6_9HYPH|nr:hypothetical protein [Rhizobium paknamense]MDQ0453982.1 hypothetical protein [Rhizobium paknamense]